MKDLFGNIVNEETNLLPRDGIVNYYGKLFSAEERNFYLDYLLNHISWRNDEVKIYGKHIVTKRKIAWFGDDDFSYTYSKTTKHALPWTEELFSLKKIIEEKTGDQFNSCLLNLYHNGTEGMSWHSDAESELKKNGSIASLTFGAERKFSFKHKTTKETVSKILENGSLLVMKGNTQTHWVHALPVTKKVYTPRVNLTFRMRVLPEKP